MKTRMITRNFIGAALLSGALLGGCVESDSTRPDPMAPAPLSSEVAALQGMRSRNLGSEMNRLGFTNIGGYKTDDASITTWWNPQGEQCVKVETRDGRADVIESLYKGNCQ